MGMVTIAAQAQLTVESNGNVRINSRLNLIGDTTYTYSGYATGAKHVQYIYNNGEGESSSDGNRRFGLSIVNALKDNMMNVGVIISPSSSSTTNTNEYGIISRVGNSSHGNYGVYGGFYNTATVTNGAGVLGSSTSIWIIPYAYRGVYAGFFNGDVRVVNGTIAGSVVTPSAMLNRESSNGVLTAAALPVTDVSERLSQIQLIQFSRKDEITDKDMKECGNLDLDEYGELTKTKIEEKMRPSTLSKVGYGLAADQLKEVYPELVYEDQNGNVSINYIEMIPLLVQANNELRARVQALENEKKGAVMVKEKMTEAATSQNAEDVTLLLSLGQNDPNPFSEQTSIEVSVPESVTSAALLFFDMQGKQVKRIDISDRGTSRITVMGQGLPEGMYLYSLVADGKVVKTRKMILSK